MDCRCPAAAAAAAEVGGAVALLVLRILLRGLGGLTERELLGGLSAVLLVLCQGRRRAVSAVFRGRTVQRGRGGGLVRCGSAGYHGALALGGRIVRNRLGDGRLESVLSGLLFGGRLGRRSRGRLFAGIARIGVDRIAAHERALRLGVVGVCGVFGTGIIAGTWVLVILRGLVDALRVEFVSHCCSFS